MGDRFNLVFWLKIKSIFMIIPRLRRFFINKGIANDKCQRVNTLSSFGDLRKLVCFITKQILLPYEMKYVLLYY